MALASRRPIVSITEIEHSAFCKTEDELPSKPLTEEMAVNVRWQQIPPEYLHYTAAELDLKIGEAVGNSAAQSPSWAIIISEKRLSSTPTFKATLFSCPVKPRPVPKPIT